MQNSYQGIQSAASSASDYNSQIFVIQRLVNRVSTATLVQVKSVTNTPGQVAAVGQVDVLPLVNQLDGDGNSTPHEIIHGLPYFRMQGGSNAVLCDPVVGDIGLAIFCHNDIQTVKSSKAQGHPGSRRHHDLADGIYFGLCLSGTPNQYIAFTNSGILIQDKNNNKIELKSSGVFVTSNGITIDLGTHKHSGVMAGGAQTGAPVDGT